MFYDALCKLSRQNTRYPGRLSLEVVADARWAADLLDPEAIVTPGLFVDRLVAVRDGQ